MAMNLKYTWITTQSGISDAMAKGIVQLYKNVFADPPYEEQFKDSEVLEALGTVVSAGGFLLVAEQAEALGRIIAFVATMPMRAVPDMAEKLGGVIDVRKAAYFAEDAVEKSLRRNHVSEQMKTAILERNWKAGFDTVVLRTAAANIKQINAVTKKGARVVSGVFQDVSQVRQDGNLTTDRRGFYVFDRLNTAADIISLGRVTIARPGGNDTAFVWDAVPRNRQGSLSKLIQAQCPNVEQVMFIERTPEGTVHGQMAGGEFCGNATRTLGYLLLDGKDGVIDVSVSGASEKMRVSVSNGQAKTQIPVRADLNSVQPMGQTGDYIVRLDGISFLLTSPDSRYGASILNQMADPDKRDGTVKNFLKQVGLIDEPASGVMIAHQKNGQLRCEPFVYVRDTQTLYYESGCGSGSTALGVMHAFKEGRDVTGLEVIQPSGLPLVVSVERTANAFKCAHVNGPVQILNDGPLLLPKATYKVEGPVYAVA